MATEGIGAAMAEWFGGRPRVGVGLALTCLAIGSLTMVAMSSDRAGGVAVAASSTPSPARSEAVAAATISPTASPTPSAVPSPPATPTTRPDPTVHESFVANGTEPTTAADPFRAGVVAVVSETLLPAGDTSGCRWPVVRVSRDGGATWSGANYPWGVHCGDIHTVIAWGPNGRLWAGNAAGITGSLSMSVTHSDDYGETWSVPFVEHFTPPWVGCFPTLAVDTWPASPNFGTVYVAYNWLPNQYGPGVALMASRDGDSWVHAEVPLDTLRDYPYAWRFGYRIEPAPDGSAYVSYYQANFRMWSAADLFKEGSIGNVGQRGFEVAHVRFDGRDLKADAPTWATTVDTMDAQFQSGLAVDDSGTAWLAVQTAGKIRVGRLDGSGTWRELSVPDQKSFKPSLAIEGRTVFVGWHATDAGGRIRTYYTFSYDGGETFRPPALVTTSVWRDPDVMNSVGLRENADFALGVVYYGYGDARSGIGVYLARIEP